MAALLAFSREAAARYHERYDGQPSEIASQMAGHPITRPTDLLSLTTTSFYGAGSSQYSRLSLRTEAREVRWRAVGFSRGHGTLHFSRSTSRKLHELLRLETGQSLLTSTFGEGPSERLRKVRDGLAMLGLDADALLRHGMPRQAFIAELSPGATRPGSGAAGRPWRLVGPSVDEVADAWRQRWLGPRITRPGVIDSVREFRPVDALVSRRAAAPDERDEDQAEGE
jgi:hypothetical protein